MKKDLTLLFCAALIFCSSCSTSPHHVKTSWEFDDLKGEVKTLKTITYNVIDTLGEVTKGEIVDNVYGSILINYNSKGDWIEYRSYTPTGKNKWAEIPAFDKKGNMVERCDYTFSESDSTLDRRYRYKYDNKRNLTNTFLYNASDSLIWKRTYLYNDKGKETEICNYNATNSLTWKVVCSYDNKNNLTEENVYNASGGLDGKTIYKYNEKGERIETCSYKSDNSLESKTTTQYNKEGLEIEACTYNTEGNLDKRKSYQYKFDSKGNWIEKISYNGDTAIRITEREIEYYK